MKASEQNLPVYSSSLSLLDFFLFRCDLRFPAFPEKKEEEMIKEREKYQTSFLKRV